MTPPPPFDQLRALISEQGKLESIMGLLEWDTETLLPPKGIKARGSQRAALAGVLHRQRTSPEMQDLVESLRGKLSTLEPDQAAVIREIGRDLDRLIKVPSELVEAIARLEPESAAIWARARAENDFTSFEPKLREMISRKIEMADAIGWKEERYDALLEEFEPGMTTELVAPVLADLKAQVIPVSRKILGDGKGPDPRFQVEVSQDKQELFNRRVVSALGFDFEAGRLDTSTHPFCMGFHPTDVRLTTRYNETDFRSSLYGTIHEVGHGLYEQGLDVDWFGTPLGHWSSMGIHESQSRLWENIVGRSRAFWQHFLPQAKGLFPESLCRLGADDFFRGVNEVGPSLIRVEADEVHYNLHVILRFEMEREFISGRLDVSDIPELWREKSKELLDVVPETDTEGCLQDIHWSMGMYGYFPTYTLGNLYAAMFWEAANRDLGDLDPAFTRGEFGPLLGWLREHIHSQGRRYPVPELLKRVTGQELQVQSHVNYLLDKYGSLYDIGS